VLDGDDCDPLRASVHPGAAEACDGLDNDCDGEVPASEDDRDRDGYLPCTFVGESTDVLLGGDDCDDDDDDVFPGAEEICDAVDQDCDGDLVEDFGDADGDGVPDCVDGDDDDAADDDDSADDDDAGDDDDSAPVDADGDGFAASVDCDDGDPSVNPGADDWCDAVDQDCDQDIIEAWSDADGNGLPDCIPSPPPTGCSPATHGCAVSWAGNAALLLMVPLGLVRRRR